MRGWHWQPLITSIISQPWTTVSMRLLRSFKSCANNQEQVSRSQPSLAGMCCTDAYLAALAISNGWHLVSFDRGFERFGDLQRLKLNGTSSA